jgi:hypothetical protein
MFPTLHLQYTPQGRQVGFSVRHNTTESPFDIGQELAARDSMLARAAQVTTEGDLLEREDDAVSFGILLLRDVDTTVNHAHNAVAELHEDETKTKSQRESTIPSR